MGLPNKGHAWDPAFCPLEGGCPLSEVILHKVCIQVYYQLVHCLEVYPLSECPSSEVSLYILSNAWWETIEDLVCILANDNSIKCLSYVVAASSPEMPPTPLPD